MNTVKYFAYSTNRLANSPHYADILRMYNEQFAIKGKVNLRKFHRDVVLPLIPNYSYISLYQFVKRFASAAGLSIAVNKPLLERPTPEALAEQQEQFKKNLVTNAEAENEGINIALNLVLKKLKEIGDDPINNSKQITLKDAVGFLTQIMKTRDSRINAIGKVKEDNRVQAKFEHAFGNAAYETEKSLDAPLDKIEIQETGSLPETNINVINPANEQAN